MAQHLIIDLGIHSNFSEITPTVHQTATVPSWARFAAGGAAAADALAKLIGEKGKVMVIAFQAGASTSDQRQKGFEGEIRKYPNIRSRRAQPGV